MLEIIAEFITEFVLRGILFPIFKGVKFLGIIVIKLLTLNDKSVKELKKDYKDSSKPYWLGFGISIGVIYWLIN